MPTIEKKTAAEKAIDKQLEAIKDQAIELWGDEWEARLCNAYEQRNGYKHRSKNSKVRAWFDGSYISDNHYPARGRKQHSSKCST